NAMTPIRPRASATADFAASIDAAVTASMVPLNAAVTIDATISANHTAFIIARPSSAPVHTRRGYQSEMQQIATIRAHSPLLWGGVLRSKELAARSAVCAAAAASPSPIHVVHWPHAFPSATAHCS